MKIPRTPPNVGEIINTVDVYQFFSEDIVKYAREFNNDYLHWDDLLHRDTGDIYPKIIWAMMKFQRNNSIKDLFFSNLKIRYSIPDDCHRELHEIDSITSDLVSIDKMNEKDRMIYSVSSMMEESIASSQIEGAVTSTKIAKTMLRENTHPKDRSEQMILNNYDAMRFIKTRMNRRLTPELIQEIHSVIVKDTMEEQYVGIFRDDDDVVVKDVYADDVFYKPVEHGRINSLIQALCDFVNNDEHYIHPIVKGIIIHYVMAIIHPFCDGNGRVSRALFYWYTMKKGYWFMEFLSISKSIKSHRSKYDRAYLLSETDGNDMTYFIIYNLNVLKDATDTFLRYLDRKMKEQLLIIEKITGLDLNLRQKTILSDLVSSNELISVRSISSKYQVSMNTARSDVEKMLSMGLIEKDSLNVNRVMYRHNVFNG